MPVVETQGIGAEPATNGSPLSKPAPSPSPSPKSSSSPTKTWPKPSAKPRRGCKNGKSPRNDSHVYTRRLYIHAVRGRVQSVADTLFEIAEEQQGYFTAKQAAAVGYRLGSQAHHVKAGNWVRVHRGIYRLARFPQSDQDQLVIYSLWSRDRSGKPEGVYSHQTALSIHELSDINPSKLHLSVPPTFRRSATVPSILVLHRAVLEEKDIEQRQGFTVVRPLKTIIDLAASELVSRDIIEQAMAEGRRRGLITTRELGERRCEMRQILWWETLLSEPPGACAEFPPRPG